MSNKITSKRSFHFWNSFNFLLVIMIITMLVLRVCNYAKLTKAVEVSRLVYNWLAFACGFACLAYFICLRRKCGRLPGDYVWLFGGCWLVAKGVIVHFSIKIFGIDAFPAEAYIIIHVVCLLALLSFLNVNTMIAVNCFLKQNKKVDYALIHGARTGSRVVNNRTDAAAEYLREQPEVVAIASGGRGNDEQMSEAQYISNRLEEHGIAPDHIILEDKSTTTYENLAFSKEYMPENASFMVVTDDYHILRARLMAKKVYGYMPEGLPVHSSRVSLPYYILREYLSLISNALRGHMI